MADLPGALRIGVIGAGTMGSGIALAALAAGMDVCLYDVSDSVLEAARVYVAKYLARKDRAGALGNLTPTTELSTLGGSACVLEAVPEAMPLKQQVFASLDDACPKAKFLATNTSTLSVSAIASATKHPERVVGMHFFNPAAVLPLVEVVRGKATSQAAVDGAVALAVRLGKTPVVASDTPGFIVNRVARPYYGEALELLEQGVADPATLDRLMELSGGFKMGLFRLMDLIGIDVNYAATESVYEQMDRLPRYRPHDRQRRMVEAGTLGRKSGRGFYDYGTQASGGDPPRSPEQPGPAGAVACVPGDWAPGLQDLLANAGFEVVEPGGTAAIAGFVGVGGEEGLRQALSAVEAGLAPDRTVLCQAVDRRLSEMSSWARHPSRLVGFDGLFLVSGAAVTLSAGPAADESTRQRSEAIMARLGREPQWVADAPGMVVPRLLAMLVNEAAFAVEDGVADGVTIDQAMRLGVNYPYGPIEWGGAVGFARLARILDLLAGLYQDDRYRVSGELRRWAAAEGRSASLAAGHPSVV